MLDKELAEKLEKINWLEEVFKSKHDAKNSGIGLGLTFSASVWSFTDFKYVVFIQIIIGAIIAFYFSSKSYKRKYVEKYGEALNTLTDYVNKYWSREMLKMIKRRSKRV